MPVEALAPDFVFQQTGGFQRQVAAFEVAVGFQRAGQGGRVEQFAGHFGEGLGLSGPTAFAQGGAGGHGVAAEAEEQTGGALGDKVERIAQVQSGNRAAGTLDDAAFAGREETPGGAACP